MTDKLVIFDCDGVLVDNEALSLRALVSCLGSCGIAKRECDFNPARYKGAKLAKILEEIEQEFGITLPPEFENQYRNRMDDFFSTELRAIDGVANALDRIPFRVCVASSGPIHKIRRSLELTGLSKYFGENLFSSYSIQSWKPEPGIFLHAAKEMGAMATNCVVVEDALLGIQAAVSAGMQAAALVSDKENEQAAIELGAMPFSRMKDLPKLVQGLLR